MTAGATPGPASSAVPVRAGSNTTVAAGPARTRSDSRAITCAAAALGIEVIDLQPVAQGRTGVYRVEIHADRPHEGFPAGPGVHAARVSTWTDSINSTRRTHRAVHDLRQRGAPVAVPRHRDAVATAHGEVGFWEWMDPTLVTSREWGALTAAFHRCGRRIRGLRAYHPATVFTPRLLRARELTDEPGHPLFGAQRLLRCVESALEVAVDRALAAAATGSQVLVHGDNQPGNVMRAGGGPVLNDFERLATGPAGLDLAAVVLGLQHFGYPEEVGEEFRTGYGPDAPSLKAAQPYARIRELSGIVIAMIQAGESPQMEREMRIRTVAIANPGDGQPWTFLGNPDAMRLAGLTGPGHGGVDQARSGPAQGPAHCEARVNRVDPPMQGVRG